MQIVNNRRLYEVALSYDFCNRHWHAIESVFAQDRMPAIPLEKMTDLQKKYAEEIIKGPRGALYGPFVPLIRSPELMDRAQRVGEYLRYKSAIGTKLSELVILITARQWTQQVEWAIHEPIAIKSGIKGEIVSAIADGRYPTGMSADEQIVYDFCTELHVNKSVSDTTYERARETLWRAGCYRHAGHQRLLHFSGDDHERYAHRSAGWQARTSEGISEVKIT